MNVTHSLKELSTPPFVALWIASFVIGTLSAPVMSLLAVYVEAELGRTPLFSAGLRSLFILLGGLFAVPAGILCDKIGTKKTYVLGSTGALVSGLIFLTDRPVWLVAICVYIGVATGFSTTASQAYLIHAAPRSSLGLGSAAFFLGSTLGSALGNRLTGLVVDTAGFRTIGIWMSAAMLVVLVGITLLMPELASRPAAGVRSRASWRDYTRLLARPSIRLLVGVRYLPTCYWGAATLLIPLLIFRATGTTSSAANYTAVSLCVASLFQVMTGRLCDRFGPKTPALVASIGVTASALLTAIFARSALGLYVFGVTGAAAAWSLSTTMPGIINDVSGPDEKGQVVGMAHLAWSVGMLTGSLWGGKAIESSAGLPFYVVTACGMMTVGLLKRLFQRQR